MPTGDDFSDRTGGRRHRLAPTTLLVALGLAQSPSQPSRKPCQERRHGRQGHDPIACAFVFHQALFELSGQVTAALGVAAQLFNGAFEHADSFCRSRSRRSRYLRRTGRLGHRLHGSFHSRCGWRRRLDEIQLQARVGGTGRCRLAGLNLRRLLRLPSGQGRAALSSALSAALGCLRIQRRGPGYRTALSRAWAGRASRGARIGVGCSGRPRPRDRHGGADRQRSRLRCRRGVGGKGRRQRRRGCAGRIGQDHILATDPGGAPNGQQNLDHRLIDAAGGHHANTGRIRTGTLHLGAHRAGWKASVAGADFRCHALWPQRLACFQSHLNWKVQWLTQHGRRPACTQTGGPGSRCRNGRDASNRQRQPGLFCVHEVRGASVPNLERL